MDFAAVPGCPLCFQCPCVSLLFGRGLRRTREDSASGEVGEGCEGQTSGGFATSGAGRATSSSESCAPSPGAGTCRLPADDSLKRMIRQWINSDRDLSAMYAELLTLVFGLPFETGRDAEPDDGALALAERLSRTASALDAELVLLLEQQTDSYRTLDRRLGARRVLAQNEAHIQQMTRSPGLRTVRPQPDGACGSGRRGSSSGRLAGSRSRPARSGVGLARDSQGQRPRQRERGSDRVRDRGAGVRTARPRTRPVTL